MYETLNKSQIGINYNSLNNHLLKLDLDFNLRYRALHS